jgi:protoheme IX farnesyltransferase
VIRKYISLTKTGIIRGNLMVGAAGFLFAANGNVDWWLLLAFLAGTGLIIASGCVFNNVLDRDIDKRMKRTENRALVTGEISVWNALVFATALGIAGPLLLLLQVNVLTCVLGLLGLVFYVVVYGLAKRTTPLSTIIGSLPGAVPPAAGYVAVTGAFDAAAAVLFLTMALWQMPHFYAISIYRRDDYAAAKLPVWSVAYGLAAARNHVIAFAVLYLATIPLLWLWGGASLSYLIIMGLAGAAWLWFALRGLPLGDKDLPRWAKQIFGTSLLLVLVWSLVLSLNWLLP